MRSRVLGAVDLVCLHQDLRIQKDPVPGTLLEVQTRPRVFRDLPPDQNRMIYSAVII